MGTAHNGFRQAYLFPHPDPGPLLPANEVRCPAVTYPGFTGVGLAHGAGQALIGLFQPYQDPPHGSARDEPAGAVDGIDQPGKRVGSLCCAELLADDGMAGKFGGNSRADELFRFPVGPGDRIERFSLQAFVRYRQVAPEILQWNLTGLFDKTLQERHIAG